MKEISTTQLQDLLNHKEIKLFDVRTLLEYAAGHVPESINFPLEKVDEFDFPKDEQYYFICRSGNRSGQFCQYLSSHGYQDVIDVLGGMLDWQGKVESEF